MSIVCSFFSIPTLVFKPTPTTDEYMKELVSSLLQNILNSQSSMEQLNPAKFNILKLFLKNLIRLIIKTGHKDAG